MTSLKSAPPFSSARTDAVLTSSHPVEGALSARRFATVVGSCAAFCLLVLLAAPWVGAVNLSFDRVLSGTNPDFDILVRARLPRILFGALVGGALAVAGVLFQAILRNSLATPFTLGISSGSSFGALLAIFFGFGSTTFGLPMISFAAFIGAFMTILLVFFIAQSGDGLPTFTLLLAGVTLNFIFGALILFIHYAADFQQSYMMVRWMMGTLADADVQTIQVTAPFVLGALAVVVWASPQFNPLSAGEDWAASRGVNVRRLKNLSYFTGSVLTGSVTAFSGPIGFVGLIVPHTLRLLAGPDHRVLIPASFFLGAGFLVLCDTAARTLFAPTEIPVGVITALLGGPFFIILLKRKRGELW